MKNDYNNGSNVILHYFERFYDRFNDLSFNKKP